jgi:hypothetical protein
LQSNAAVLSPYLKHLKEVFFATCSVPQSLTEYHTTLKRVSQNVASSLLNVVQAPNNSSEEELTRTNHQPSSADQRSGGAFEFAGKRIINAASVLPLGPEYAALLSVCSIKTWIAPHLLAEVNIEAHEFYFAAHETNRVPFQFAGSETARGAYSECRMRDSV